MPRHVSIHRRAYSRFALSLLGVCFFAVNSLLAQADAGLTGDSSIVAVPVAPATSLIAEDHKYDNGDAISLTWVPSIDDQLPAGKLTGYALFRITNSSAPEKIADLFPGANNYLDEGLSGDSSYSYYLVALAGNARSESIHTAQLTPHVEWLNLSRLNLLLIAVVFGGAVIYFIETARRGKKYFIRKIAGLDAVDEAIGRATEMGRPILFIPGIQDMDDVQTIAAITILGRISRTIADYDSKILMPVSRSLVMTAARETIKTSFAAAGRPDAYNDDFVHYVTDEQFGYVAAVDGIMVREKPAATFFLGAFFAESLILAETGNSIGAIQIAGTAMPTQIPFFVAACDFALIGEELFAASAYLSGEPKQLGSLKGQDVGKGIALATILVGTAAVTIALAWHNEFFGSVLRVLNSVFRTN